MALCLQYVYNMDRPDVRHYEEYRGYLRDHFAYRKAQDRRFSHREFARKAGFTSSALVPLLVQGKRNLTPRYLEGFIAALALSPAEAAYFRALVDFTHARTDEERRKHDRALALLRSDGTRRIGLARMKFFESWIHVALHQACSCLDIAEDLSPVRDFLNPSPSLEDLRSSMALLRELGMLERNASGHWKPADPDLRGEGPLGQWIIRGFREQMVALGNTAHERVPSDRLHVMSETLALGSAASRAVEQRLVAFRDEVVGITLADQDAPAEILQLNIQLFPLSNPHEKSTP